MNALGLLFSPQHLVWLYSESASMHQFKLRIYLLNLGKIHNKGVKDHISCTWMSVSIRLLILVCMKALEHWKKEPLNPNHEIQHTELKRSLKALPFYIISWDLCSIKNENIEQCQYSHYILYCRIFPRNCSAPGKCSLHSS